MFSKLIDILGSSNAKRRARLTQWLIASMVYLGAATLLITGVGQGWMNTTALSLWLGFVFAVVVISYALLRSGWTERFRDPSVTVWQLSMGVLAVSWGYLICGPMRTSALFPIMVIFAFGAFTLRWRQITFLTVLALSSLIVAVILRTLFPHWVPARGEVPPMRLDINNVLMLVVVLPALAVVATRLSGLRRKLSEQRAALTQALLEVERLAVSDELTGIANRRSTRLMLERDVSLSSRAITPFCLAIVDIDHFKRINDELGHGAGDDVLKAFAHCVTAQLRSSDSVGRWGGEEFVVVTHGNLEGAARLMERIRHAVRTDCHATRPVAFSAGIAQHRPDESADELLARADIALYEAKRAGRDRYMVAA
ncbi:GGDEF domain-containing protein [Dyella sp.]|jgi:diguanylate cyclase (GGDEF)-like protein|uniref:GGDEF domain-containing protein n=1 Tax=Dyella sp. TaxID=1869338 RepID=UPI002D786183|nr:GGDEF domain-containing protein [Dyella sp.]HET6432399.1 GGDEF domain-containing protein [Dyella sp.]